MSSHNSSNTGSKTDRGMASMVKTPANAHLGEDKPKMFDSQGAIGKQFTGKQIPNPHTRPVFSVVLRDRNRESNI